MPKIDPEALTLRTGSNYPPHFAAMVAGRSFRRLGEAGGLTQFGVNLVILEPGAQSSLMHGHSHEDELVLVISGRCRLETPEGEWDMGPGDCAAFPAGGGELHHFVNHSSGEVRFLVAGTKAADDTVTYAPGIDMRIVKQAGVNRILHADGTPWDAP